MVPSTGLLTSCKDYDDDITNLQGQIDDLKKLVDQIQSQISNGVLLTNVTPAENGVTLALSNGKSYTITNGKDGAKGTDGQNGTPGVAGKDADIWKIGDDGFWYKNDVKTEYKAVGTDGKDGTNGMYYVPNTQTGCFDIYQDGVLVKATDIKYLAEGMITAVWTNEKVTLSGVKGADGETVEIITTATLQSLVFSPSFYYQGIEALDLATLEYNPLKTPAAADPNKNMATDRAELDGNDVFRFAPNMTAEYYMNPKNAKIDVEAKNFNFVTFDKDYLTRADAAKRNFTIVGAETKDGMLTVKAKYDGDVLKNIGTDDAVTVVALQYADDKSNKVTSDFAAVRATTYRDIALNLVSDEHNSHAIGNTHLFQTAQAAIANEPQIEVAYNSEKDLADLINTVRVPEGKPCVNWDTKASDGLLQKEGFEYSFELIGYMSGDNNTSQSAHALIKNGSVLRPQLPENGKQVTTDGTQSEATIGRMPLVRVTLKDVTNKKVVAVGYVKVSIIAAPADETPLSLTMKTSNEPYTITCAGDFTIQKLAWHDIEEQIIAQLNMSKADFERKYSLDGGQNNATQYGGDNNEALAADRYIGVISQTQSDQAGTQTEVLEWKIASNKAYNLFKDGDVKSVSTKIRYTLNAGETGTYKYVLVTFTWNPSAINNSPTAKFVNEEHKIQKYWYAANNAIAGSGYDEIHGNVQLVASGNNDDYIFDIKNTLTANKLQVAALEGAYQNLNANMVTKLTFADGFNLYAGKTNAQLLFAKEKELEQTADQLVATMTEDGVVTLAKTEVAMALLNKYAPTDLAHTLTAKVKVVATLCGNIDVPVENNTFNVKFLRPITMSEGSIEAFVDSETGGNKKDLKLTFVDWRGTKFNADFASKGIDYFAYYGVRKIEVDTNDKATTDLNGGKKLLKDVTSKIKFNYTAPAANGVQIVENDYGKLTYINNGLTVGEFHVWFPVTITYDWGSIQTEVQATVLPTNVGSAKKH